jgi:hypothetical protein
MGRNETEKIVRRLDELKIEKVGYTALSSSKRGLIILCCGFFGEGPTDRDAYFRSR